MFHEKTQTDKVRYSCIKEILPFLSSKSPPLNRLLFSKYYEKCVSAFFLYIYIFAGSFQSTMSCKKGCQDVCTCHDEAITGTN